MNSAIILAAGIGTRFGGNIPKQFVKIDGKEILSFSVNTFRTHPQIDEVIIVCHNKWMDHVSTYYPDCIIVEGGVRRQDSSLNGIKAVSNQSLNVLIHDAARPFVSNEIITNCLTALEKADGSAPVMDISNSLIQVEKERTTHVDRSIIKEVQTPQCFEKEFILQVLTDETEGTDEIGMVLKTFSDSRLEFITGSPMNNKITSNLDLNYISKMRG